VNALPSLQLEKLLRVDGNRIGIDGGRCRNSPGDNLALVSERLLNASVDQSFAELVEVENPADEDHKGCQVEE